MTFSAVERRRTFRQHHYFLLITRQANAFRKESCSSSRCDGGEVEEEEEEDWSGSSCPASRRAHTDLLFFFFFFYITKLEAWQGERTGFFDLDEGRNVEYEPEMTSQAGFRFKLTRRKKKINYVCVCVCTDPSDYSRTAGLPILTHPLPCSVHLCTPHPNNFPQTCASNLSHTKKSGAYLRTWFVSGNHLRVSVKRLYGIKKKRRKKKCLVTTGPRSL